MPSLSEPLGGVGAGAGKFAFDGDFKVAFGGAFGKDGHPDFAANLHAKFEVNFFNFNLRKIFECADDVPGIGADRAMDGFCIGFYLCFYSFGKAVAFASSAAGGFAARRIGQLSRFGRFDVDGVGGAIGIL